MELSGPAARHRLREDQVLAPTARKTRGTINNCANGYTPWGTYLTCEENWAGYFRRVAATDNPNAHRQGAWPRSRATASRATAASCWATVTPDTPDNILRPLERREARRVRGRQRRLPQRAQHLRLGRRDRSLRRRRRRRRSAPRSAASAHEGAGLRPGGRRQAAGLCTWATTRAASTSTSSSRRTAWDPPTRRRPAASPPATSTSTTASSTSRKFNADGTGAWLELTFGMNGITAANAAYAFADQADVLVNARLAADAVGATKMDRPEWAAVNPTQRRGLPHADQQQRRAAADRRRPTPPTRASTTTRRARRTAQTGNPNGHIIRLRGGRRRRRRDRPSPGTSTCSARAPAPTRPTSTSRA